MKNSGQEGETMLTKPKFGWTEFHLDGTSTYTLSYLDNIAFEWLEQAIHGLETMLPFCVKGFLEPNRFLCMVSYWNCHIVIEDDEREPLEKHDICTEYSHTSMLAFCKMLHKDISCNVDEWAVFADNHGKSDLEVKRKELLKKLEKLEKLISARESHWEADRCFL